MFLIDTLFPNKNINTPLPQSVDTTKFSIENGIIAYAGATNGGYNLSDTATVSFSQDNNWVYMTLTFKFTTSFTSSVGFGGMYGYLKYNGKYVIVQGTIVEKNPSTGADETIYAICFVDSYSPADATINTTLGVYPAQSYDSSPEITSVLGQISSGETISYQNISNISNADRVSRGIYLAYAFILCDYDDSPATVPAGYKTNFQDYGIFYEKLITREIQYV